MSLTFEQQLNILSRGCETVVHECAETRVSHFHFVGAPFRGLMSHDLRVKREKEKYDRNVIKASKQITKTAVKVSFDEEEGWKMVYEMAELSYKDTFVVEQVIVQQRRFLLRRIKSDDPYNPHPFIERLDEEIAFSENSARVINELAKHRNKLIHALNGNIHQVGDAYVDDGEVRHWTEEQVQAMIRKQFSFCIGVPTEEIDYVSLLYELDSLENRKITVIFDMVTAGTGQASVQIRDERVYATGYGKNKKLAKIDTCKNLLEKLLSSYYFGCLGRISMIIENFPPQVTKFS